MVGASHHLEEELDPDPHFSKKLNPDPDLSDEDPQPRLKPAIRNELERYLRTLNRKFLSHNRNYVLRVLENVNELNGDDGVN